MSKMFGKNVPQYVMAIVIYLFTDIILNNNVLSKLYKLFYSLNLVE